MRCTLLAATCCIDALKISMFALFDVAAWDKTDADRFPMCVAIDLTMVSAVLLYETSSLVVRPEKWLLEA